jgi:hypothetical protein
VQYNSFVDRQDFGFVTLVDIPNSERILFSDKGWDGSADKFAPHLEGLLSWRPPTAGVAAGTFVRISGVEGDSLVSTRGSVSRTGHFRLGNGGDQIFAFQGSVDKPIFIYGLQNNNDSNGHPTETTFVPPFLLPGTTYLELFEIKNTAYSGPTIGTRQELLQAISNSANWYKKRSFDYNDEQRFDPSAFIIS